MKYSILVIWNDRTEEYLQKGSEIAEFKNWEEADKMREFMLQGIRDEVQSINVVRRGMDSCLLDEIDERGLAFVRGYEGDL